MSAIEELPISGRCSKCHRNTTAEMDPYEKEPMTICCWAPLIDPSDAVDANDDRL